MGIAISALFFLKDGICKPSAFPVLIARCLIPMFGTYAEEQY